MATEYREEDFREYITNPNEPHMECILLLDTSGSMEGSAIASLNEAVARFKREVCLDTEASKRVDIAIITFGRQVQLVSDFRPVTNMPLFSLEAEGRTPMAEAVQMAVDILKKRIHQNKNMGVSFYKPWIFMITDGASTSDMTAMDEAANRVRRESQKAGSEGLKFWALGVDNYDKEQLFKFTDWVIELEQHDFTDIFSWLSRSMSEISHSQVGGVAILDDLPPGSQRVKKGFSIDV